MKYNFAVVQFDTSRTDVRRPNTVCVCGSTMNQVASVFLFSHESTFKMSVRQFVLVVGRDIVDHTSVAIPFQELLDDQVMIECAIHLIEFVIHLKKLAVHFREFAAYLTEFSTHLKQARGILSSVVYL